MLVVLTLVKYFIWIFCYPHSFHSFFSYSWKILTFYFKLNRIINSKVNQIRKKIEYTFLHKSMERNFRYYEGIVIVLTNENNKNVVIRVSHQFIPTEEECKYWILYDNILWFNFVWKVTIARAKLVLISGLPWKQSMCVR